MTQKAAVGPVGFLPGEQHVQGMVLMSVTIASLVCMTPTAQCEDRHASRRNERINYCRDFSLNPKLLLDPV